MNKVVSIDSMGRVYIPKQFREKMGIVAWAKVECSWDEDKQMVCIKPRNEEEVKHE
jgi:bifunctional DNA-binding transcriptional regulator/antitoxin component of YhaV-PrlF toxin-antitoxin module